MLNAGPTSSKRPRLDNGVPSGQNGSGQNRHYQHYPPADQAIRSHNNQAYNDHNRQMYHKSNGASVIPPPPHPPALQQQPPLQPQNQTLQQPQQQHQAPVPHERNIEHRPKPPQPSHNHHRHDARNLATIVESPQVNRYAENFALMIDNRMNNRHINQFRYPYIHDVACYSKITKIGQGTFGEVFQAKCRKSNRYVALKKILMENEREGFPITAIREVKMLQRLKHDHITELIEICNAKGGDGATAREKSNFFLVFTYCDYDLAGLLSHQGVKLQLEDVKILMKHLLNGLYKIHKSNILHRDMKAANVLVSREGILKLADFGLSRPVLKSSKQNYTNRVVTLWYRPPELLLGSRKYGPQIDIWGAGCIMAELWTRSPILQGETEQKQLELIQKTCGGINSKVWPGVENLPLYGKTQLLYNHPRVLRDKMHPFTTDPAALSLLDNLLTLDPSKRTDAERALDDDFFYSQPMPKTNDIKHIVDTLPKNIFEFTAGKGAHANRHQRQNMQNGGQQNAHRRNPNNRSQFQDSQLTDMIF